MDYPDLCKCEIYYARMEVKETSKTESAVARIVLSEENLESWRQEQLEDFGISIILQGKEIEIRLSCKRLRLRKCPQRYTDPIGIFLRDQKFLEIKMVYSIKCRRLQI